MSSRRTVDQLRNNPCSRNQQCFFIETQTLFPSRHWSDTVLKDYYLPHPLAFISLHTKAKKAKVKNKSQALHFDTLKCFSSRPVKQPGDIFNFFCLSGFIPDKVESPKISFSYPVQKKKRKSNETSGAFSPAMWTFAFPATP